MCMPSSTVPGVVTNRSPLCTLNCVPAGTPVQAVDGNAAHRPPPTGCGAGGGLGVLPGLLPGTDEGGAVVVVVGAAESVVVVGKSSWFGPGSMPVLRAPQPAIPRLPSSMAVATLTTRSVFEGRRDHATFRRPF